MKRAVQRWKVWLVPLLVVIVVLAAWWFVHERSGVTGAHDGRPPLAAERGVDAPPAAQAPRAPAQPARVPSQEAPAPPSAGATTTAAIPAGSPPSGASAPAPTAAGTVPAPGPAAPRPALPARPGEASAGELTDRTGWDDKTLGKQLNKEFMPLASECIDQATARRPGLRGLLGFSMVLAPTDTGRAIVASIKLRKDNQIDDPELLECIRESSFALDGLKAPHDFDITMPVGPDAR